MLRALSCEQDLVGVSLGKPPFKIVDICALDVGAFGVAAACDFTPFVKKEKLYPDCIFLPPFPATRIFKEMKDITGYLEWCHDGGSHNIQGGLREVIARSVCVEERGEGTHFPVKIVLEKLPHLIADIQVKATAPLISMLSVMDAADLNAMQGGVTCTNKALRQIAENGAPKVGLMGLLSALRDPEVQKAMGIMLTILKAMGSCMEEKTSKRKA